MNVHIRAQIGGRGIDGPAQTDQHAGRLAEFLTKTNVLGVSPCLTA